MKLSEWRLKMTENVSSVLTKLSAGADKVSGKFVKVQDNINRAKQNLRSMADEIPILNRALSLLKNPYALAAAGALAVGVAMGAGTGKALQYEQGMAEINATAQLTQDQLAILRNRLLEVDGVAPERVPKAYEAILSQVNDVGLSMDILETSVKGARAGFTDLDVVSKALSKSLSIVGQENATAEEVLDTFFKAKEVGAGEFKDFAEYVPGLIAAGKNLGIEYKEVTGLFSFMATQSKDAARATTLLENAFSALGKADILEGLSDEGIEVFNQDGSIRAMDQIMAQLKTKLDGLSNQGRVDFLDKIGLRDIQAKEAISILTGDVEKLGSMLRDTADAGGSTKEALENTVNPLQAYNDATNDLNTALTKMGYSNLPIVTWAAKLLGSIFGWMADNADIVYGALAGLAIGLVVAAVQTGLLTTAVWANTMAWLANPMVWIPAVIMALVAAVVWAYREFDVFRGIIWGAWEAIKGFGEMIWNLVLGAFKEILTGIGGIGKAIWKMVTGDWSGAWQEAKDAVGHLAMLDTGEQLVSDAKKLGENVVAGYNEGVASKPTDSSSWMEQLGLGSPEIPGAGGNNKTPGGTVGGGGGDNVKKGLSGISGGGKEIKSVTFNVNKIVEKIVIEAKESKRQGEDLRKIVEEEIVRAFHGAELAISNDY